VRTGWAGADVAPARSGVGRSGPVALLGNSREVGSCGCAGFGCCNGLLDHFNLSGKLVGCDNFSNCD
jgi:hypothetical protein